jgi:hypothetical protein
MRGLKINFEFFICCCMIICFKSDFTNSSSSSLHVTQAFESQFIDSKCNISILNNQTKFFVHPNDTFKYVECVSESSVVVRDCIEEAVTWYPWLNCTIFREDIVLNETQVVESDKVFYGNQSIKDGSFNDSRCDETVVNGTKYLNSVENPEQFVECLSFGVGRMRDCLEDGVLTNLSSINCTVVNKLASISNVSLRSLTKNLLLVPEELQFAVNVTSCGENDVNCTFSNETQLIQSGLSNFTVSNESVLVNDSSLLSREFILRSLSDKLVFSSNELKFVFNESRCDEEVLSGIKYLNYTLDGSKVVECVKLGLGLLHDCLEDGPWVNATWIDCFTKNDTDLDVNSLPEFVPLIPIVSNYSSSARNSSQLTNLTCVNGVLDVLSTMPVCICLMNFVGDQCEVSMVITNFTTYYQQVLNKTFDIDSYDPYLKIKRGQPCLFKLINLLGSQNQALVDYKNFIEYIVGNYWTQFDMQGFFMQNVDYDSVFNSSNAGYQIQKMKLYTQKVSDDLSKNFVQYRRALKRLSKIYKNSSSVILRKAKSFEKTMSFSNFTAYEIEIKKEVANALVSVTKLYDEYSNFVQVGNVSNATAVIDSLRESTYKYSYMVNDYGFWYLICKLNSFDKYITKYNQVSLF